MEIVIPFIYDEVNYFFNGSAKVSINEKWGLINKVGQLVLQCIYDDIDYFFTDDYNVVAINYNIWTNLCETGYFNNQGIEYWED